MDLQRAAVSDTMGPMCLLSDDQIRQDIKQRMKGADVSMDELAKELGVTKGRVSQILGEAKEGKKEPEPLPYNFRERAIAAMRRIYARRGKFLGFDLSVEE
jgi:hypothetical protein